MYRYKRYLRCNKINSRYIDNLHRLSWFGIISSYYFTILNAILTCKNINIMFTIKINSHYTDHSHYLFWFAIVPLYFIIQIPSATDDIDNSIYHRNYFVLYRYILYHFIYPWFAICFIATIQNTNTIIRFYMNIIFVIKCERDCFSFLSFFFLLYKNKNLSRTRTFRSYRPLIYCLQNSYE